MNYRLRIFILLAFALVLLGAAFTVQAQDTPPDTCRQIQELALASIDNLCTDLEGNIACYGYTNIQAQDVAGVEDFFETAGERRPLAEFIEIQTLYDPFLLEWGVAVLTLEVDPTQNIELLLTGDAQMENVNTPSSFYFRTTESDCLEVPSALTVRTPENIRITFTVNGAQIEVGSTVMLRTLDPGNVFQIYTIEGNAAVFDPVTGARTPIPEGQVAERCLSQPQSLGADGEADDMVVYDSCAWTRPVPASEADIAAGQSITQAFQRIDNAPAAPDPIVTQPPPTVNACPPGFSNFTHVVVRGENLFRIARRYGKSYVDIARDNGIATPQILSAGTVLNILCGRETGQSSFAPATPIPQPTTLTAAIIGCNVTNTSTAVVDFTWSGADPSGIVVTTNAPPTTNFAGASGTGTVSVSLQFPNPILTITSPGRTPFTLSIACGGPVTQTNLTVAYTGCSTGLGDPVAQAAPGQARTILTFEWFGADTSGLSVSGNGGSVTVPGATGRSGIDVTSIPTGTLTFTTPGSAPVSLPYNCGTTTVQPIPFSATAVTCRSLFGSTVDQLTLSWSGAGVNGVRISGNSLVNGSTSETGASGRVILDTNGVYTAPGGAGDPAAANAVVQVTPLFPISVEAVDTGEQVILSICQTVVGGG